MSTSEAFICGAEALDFAVSEKMIQLMFLISQINL